MLHSLFGTVFSSKEKLPYFVVVAAGALNAETTVLHSVCCINNVRIMVQEAVQLRGSLPHA